ncbi:MAG TPA: helix-turn-helix domain-containing protein [Longimicrobiaceae bacterium]|nr:helix-turn-helix domain-containing protein [Longimicrobiaceae bacterium]
MRRTRRPLLVFHPDSEFRNRVVLAGGAAFACWSVSEWGTLRDALRDAPPTAVVIVDPYMGAERREISPQLRALLREFPSVSVVAALTPRRGAESDIQALGMLGISEVILIGVEDSPQGIRRIVRQAEGRFLKNLLARHLPSYVSGRARIILMAAAEAISGGGHAPDLARALSISTKTLARWSERSFLPPPRRLLAWVRVLLACTLLDDPERTVSAVARACGYTSDTALRRALLDFLQMGPTPLRESGALAVASRAFLAELNELREKGRERKRRKRRGGADREPGPDG